MNNIFKINENYFIVGEDVVCVDDSLVKEGDWCRTNYGIDKVDKVGIGGIRYFNTLSMCWNIHEFKSNGVYKIILSTNPTHGVPLLEFPSREDEIEALAKQKYPVNIINNGSDKNYSAFDTNKYLRSAFIEGLNSAKFGDYLQLTTSEKRSF